MKTNKFEGLFLVKKPVIGMIHLYGRDSGERVERAIEEISIYQRCGLDGVIIENYARGSSVEDIEGVLESSRPEGIIYGVNVLGDPCQGFEISSEFDNVKFLQFDSVMSNSLDVERYDFLRKNNPGVVVLGGVRYKSTKPTMNKLRDDVLEGIKMSDAIFTGGDEYGQVASPRKLKEFREYMGDDFPLLSRGGVTINNLLEQLTNCDGVIVGTHFKPVGNLEGKVVEGRTNNFMDKVFEIRGD